ncbi:MAG: 23S rRNA (pseudouridine(1915)-N(3))-methyltransferase RlmH [Alphaproteobacteria bacterium]|nr:23S rRNA (pseudouridine(1915)-N(3))-methyltransferase RlmH [Alphaproteobacteria bacterium]
MRLMIASVGKLKDASERTLFTRYQNRIDSLGRGLGFASLELREISESRAKTATQRKSEEAQNLSSVLSSTTITVALDERGTTMTSRAFATWIADIRDQGTASLAFVIGGPDGHDETIRAAARKTLALSGFTLPHGLARIILVEQIYRALTILSNHPYHRD